MVTAALAFWVPALFTPDAAVRHAAAVALLLATLTQPMAALAFVLDGLILGISDYVAMRRAMILAIGAYVPGAALVLRFHALSLPGIWTALGLWLAAPRHAARPPLARPVQPAGLAAAFPAPARPRGIAWMTGWGPW